MLLQCLKVSAMFLLTSILAITRFSLNVMACPEGTNPDIWSLLNGRCVEFQTTVQPNLFCDKRRNCSVIADEFISAFSYQPTCNVNYTRFLRFLELTDHPLPTSKTIFWENVYGAIHRYTDKGRRLMAISDTLYGFLAHSLKYCAQPEEPGMIFNKTCAGFSDNAVCEFNADYSFWIAASIKFATDVAGKVYLMLNSSMEETFKDKSYFATYELPNFRADKVTSIEILLVRYPGLTTRSTCSSDASLSKLKDILKKKGIKTTCVDSPRSVQMVFCGDYPDDLECTFVVDVSSRITSCSTILVVFLIIAYFQFLD